MFFIIIVFGTTVILLLIDFIKWIGEKINEHKYYNTPIVIVEDFNPELELIEQQIDNAGKMLVLLENQYRRERDEEKQIKLLKQIGNTQKTLETLHRKRERL